MTSNDQPAPETDEQAALRLSKAALVAARKAVAEIQRTLRTIAEDIAHRKPA